MQGGLDDLRMEDDQAGPNVRLTLGNVKGLTTVLQAIKPSAKQVRFVVGGGWVGRLPIACCDRR